MTKLVNQKGKDVTPIEEAELAFVKDFFRAAGIELASDKAEEAFWVLCGLSDYAVSRTLKGDYPIVASLKNKGLVP